MDVAVTGQTVAALSLQARIEQCEAEINEAHGNLDSIEARAGEEEHPTVEGVMAAINRCIGKMVDLNRRLSSLADKVGTL